MDLSKFLEHLGETKDFYDWKIEKNIRDSIRGYKKLQRRDLFLTKVLEDGWQELEFCPITAVHRYVTGDYYDTCAVDRAAKELELSDNLRDKIANAADGHYYELSELEDLHKKMKLIVGL